MARKKGHEDHVNHEAWAIPYGDLITLLLAFFVVMYSISSVNEGKYKVLSDSLSEAFGGPPKSIKPLQFGNKQQRGIDNDRKFNMLEKQNIEQSIGGTTRDLKNPSAIPPRVQTPIPSQQLERNGATGYERSRGALLRMADQVERAMGDLIVKKMIVVRRTEQWLEIEIKTDILFGSGSAALSAQSQPVLQKLAAILKTFPNTLRIEGHTDNVPIASAAFPSNWELSAARAAGVVHLFMREGVDPRRMSVEGLGEFKPAADNASVDGRNRNRRVVLVVLGEGDERRLGALSAQAAEDTAPAGTAVVPAGTLEALEEGA